MKLPIINHRAKRNPVIVPGLIALSLALIGLTTYTFVKDSRSQVDLDTLTVPITEKDLNVEI